MGRARQQNSLLDVLHDHILMNVLEKLSDPSDRRAWSLVCKHFLRLESCCRKSVQVLRAEALPCVLRRYNQLQYLNLSSCSQVTDASLQCVAQATGKHLRSINLSKVGTFTEVGLSVLASECVSLLDLDLSHCFQVRDLGAIAVARISTLQSLRLVSCREITDAGVGCIATGCKRLLTLNLKWCLGITDKSVALIGVNCRELRILDLSYTEITNQGLACITNLDCLENLSMVACHNVDDEGLAYLKNGCKSLQMLDVAKCQSVSHMGIMGLANGSFPLQQLTLSYCLPITNALLRSFQKLEGLQSLRFDGCDVGGSDLGSIGDSCKILRELSLSKCRGVTDSGVSAAVEGCRGLQKLDLTCCRELTDVALSSISTYCRDLVSLRMESCSHISESGLALLGDSCRLLEELDFTDSTINDVGLMSLAKCTSLKTLKLGFCFDITDKGLAHVAAGCPNLRELDVYRSEGIGDHGVVAIARGCPRLKVLNLSYCSAITDASLKSIAQLRDIHILEIRGCVLVSSVGISAVVKGCQRLAELDVKRCTSVDDNGFMALAKHCTTLRQINLSYCTLSDLGLMAISKINCMQNMRLIHIKNVSIEGLAEALMACESLKKVKILARLMLVLPLPIIEHVENRGCRFRWMEKPL